MTRLKTFLASGLILVLNATLASASQTTTSGSPDLVTAAEASQKAITIMTHKNYSAQQYQTLDAMAKASKDTQSKHACLLALSHDAKNNILPTWDRVDNEFTKLMQACGYTSTNTVGIYGQASQSCHDRYMVQFNHPPITVCSKLADKPNRRDPSCFTVDTQYNTVASDTAVDYVAKAKSCQ